MTMTTSNEALDRAKRFVITTGYADCERCKGTGALVADHYCGNGTRRSCITCPACLDRAVSEGR